MQKQDELLFTIHQFGEYKLNTEETKKPQTNKQKTQQHPLKPLVYISLWKPKNSSNIYRLLPIVHFVSLLADWLKKDGGNGMGFF